MTWWPEECSAHSYPPSLHQITLDVQEWNPDFDSGNLEIIEAFLEMVLKRAPNINSICLIGFVSLAVIEKAAHITKLRCFNVSHIFFDHISRPNLCKVIDQLATLGTLARLSLPPLFDLDIPVTTGFQSLKYLDIAAKPEVVTQLLNTVSTYNQLRDVTLKLVDADYIPGSYRACLNTLSALSGATLRHVHIAGSHMVEHDGSLVETLKPLLLLDQLLSVGIVFYDTHISVEDFRLIASSWPKLEDLVLSPEIRMGLSFDGCNALAAFPYSCPTLQTLYMRLSGDILSDRIYWQISTHSLRYVTFSISDMQRPVSDMLGLLSCIFPGVASVMLLNDSGPVHHHHHHTHDGDGGDEGDDEQGSDGEADEEDEDGDGSEEDGDYNEESDDSEESDSEEEESGRSEDQTIDGHEEIDDDEAAELRGEEERNGITADLEESNHVNGDAEQSRGDIGSLPWPLLQMARLHSLEIDIPGLPVSVKDVHAIAGVCPNLKELQLLSPVYQEFPSESGFLALASLARLCPNLLDITILAVNWSQPSVDNWPPLSHGLQSLSLNLRKSWKSRPMNLIAYLSLLFPDIRTITCDGDIKDADQEHHINLHQDYLSGICYPLRKLTQLSHLDIGFGGRAISLSDINTIATTCPNLEILYAELTVVQDQLAIDGSGFYALVYLARLCPKLRILHIRVSGQYLFDFSGCLCFTHNLTELELRVGNIQDPSRLAELVACIFPKLSKGKFKGPRSLRPLLRDANRLLEQKLRAS